MGIPSELCTFTALTEKHDQNKIITMKQIARKLSVGLLCLSSLVGGAVHADSLADKFKNIPEEQRVAVYWYWMSDNISVQGVQHDLEAMKKAGITRAYIGNIWQNSVKPGNIKVLTPEWWEVVHAALKRASELDIEIGMFNCPGWSQSGGPWIKPTEAMRYLKEESVEVTGNGKQQAIKQGCHRRTRAGHTAAHSNTRHLAHHRQEG